MDKEVVPLSNSEVFLKPGWLVYPNENRVGITPNKPPLNESEASDVNFSS